MFHYLTSSRLIFDIFLGSQRSETKDQIISELELIALFISKENFSADPIIFEFPVFLLFPSPCNLKVHQLVEFRWGMKIHNNSFFAAVPCKAASL